MTDRSAYVGRFAPSPTGPLHVGSLLAALASYLDARRAGGRWLLRMEDVDPPREMPGAADAILRTLDAHGLTWDGPVLYQSTRGEAYLEALEHLARDDRLFPCTCTRSLLGPGGSCAGRCVPRHDTPHTLRLRLGSTRSFEDLILGPQTPSGDPMDRVLRRRDGLFAYTLAVVVDDAWEGITHVIRGRDLLGETSVQLQLFDALGHRPPTYGHIPLLYNEVGTKLSKQTGAPALDDSEASANLRRALAYLQQPDPAPGLASPTEILDAATATWNLQYLSTTDQGDLIHPTRS